MKAPITSKLIWFNYVTGELTFEWRWSFLYQGKQWNTRLALSQTLKESP